MSIITIEEQAIEKLNNVLNSDEFNSMFGGYNEEAHLEGDNILCDFLRSLGYNEVVDLYEDITPKYYG